MPRIAVVLLNLGGPDTLTAVKPFLFNMFSDWAILRMPKVPRYILAKLISTLRNKKAKGIYARMGGGSPLLQNTKTQAAALEAVLKESGMDAKVFVCMRYWHPMSAEVSAEVNAFAPDRIVLLPLYPQYSTTTTQSSFRDWHKTWAGANYPVTTTHMINSYQTDRSMIASFVDLAIPLVRKALGYGRPMLLLSAHGLPQSIIDAGDPYQVQVEQTAEAFATELKTQFGDVFDSIVCYQSRVGPKKWIDPATDHVIEKMAAEKRPLVVVPIAFVSDHSETLVELDQDYHDLAREHGAPYYGRVPSLACHPLFIDGLALKVYGAIQGV
ncbi:MAG: ferrochelatase [Candidatus Paracaedibacteraceae bacterium]|nr:ferrochelatase [Candidatus Paracaedibacteraceae bacterium]